MKVAHLIGSLSIGGAERMLQRLAIEHANESDVSVIVISMTNIGEPGLILKSRGIQVESLNMTGFWSAFAGFIKLLILLWKFRPNVLQTWLYWADLMGGLAAKFCRIDAVIWNIRCTHFGDGRWTGHLVKINACLSQWLPRSIICCGYTAMEFHRDKNFDSRKMVVLPNGYDLEFFSKKKFDHEPHNTKFNIEIVSIGRMDILKNYPLLIEAANLVLEKNRNVHFTIIGRNCTTDPSLIYLISKFQIGDNFKLHEELADVREPLNAADLFVSSSVSEGFPNVVAEAMAMEVPCIVTDAGDAAIIVGDTGIVVPVDDASALAEGIIKFADLTRDDRVALGAAARKRILENYEMGHVAQMYLDHYRQVARRT